MSWLALWLLAAGAGDLLRFSDSAPGRAGQERCAAVGVLVVWAVGLLGHPGNVRGILALMVLTVAEIGWVTLSAYALKHGRRHGLAVAAMVLPVLAGVGISGLATPFAGPLAHWWHGLGMRSLTAVGPDRGLLLAGLFLVQIATGNVLVRLVLSITGSLPHELAPDDPARALKGGRMLGPMERVFMLALGLWGQFLAGSIVAAAKGLLRFPELQATEGKRIDAVTEYFLVGTFVSWSISVAALALAR